MRTHTVWMNSRMMHLYSSVGFAFITFASLGSAFAAPLSSNQNGSAS